MCVRIVACFAARACGMRFVGKIEKWRMKNEFSLKLKEFSFLYLCFEQKKDKNKFTVKIFGLQFIMDGF